MLPRPYDCDLSVLQLCPCVIINGHPHSLDWASLEVKTDFQFHLIGPIEGQVLSSSSQGQGRDGRWCELILMVSTLNIVFIFSPSATEGQSPGHRCLSDQSEPMIVQS